MDAKKGSQFHQICIILKREKMKILFVVSQLEIKPSLVSYNLAESAVVVEIEGEESNVSLKDAWVSCK